MLEKNKNLILIVLYTMAYGLIPLNQGLFWDDWVIYDNTLENLVMIFGQVGSPWAAYFYHFLFSTEHSILLCRVIIFLSYLVAALLLNTILREIKEIKSYARFFIVLFFALIPVNTARITLIGISVALWYQLFFFGLFLTVQYMKNRNLFLRGALLILFFISFWLNSLLAFYSIIVGYILYVEYNASPSFKKILKRVPAYSDFILLPFIFWIVKYIYFKPSGIYQEKGFEYNVLSLKGLILAPLASIVALYTSVIEVVDQAFFHLSFFAIVLAAFLTWATFPKLKKGESSAVLSHRHFLILGLCLFFVGVFPYVAVGKWPHSGHMATRHQILVPLGASFLIYYVLEFLAAKLNLSRQILFFICFLLAVSFMNANMKYYWQFDQQWYKSLAIMDALGKSSEVKANSTFLFQDETLALNAQERPYEFYEYSGLLKRASHEDKLGEDINNPRPWAFYQTLIASGGYGLRTYVPGGPVFKIVIYPGYVKPNRVTKYLKLKFLEFAKPEEFAADVDKVVRLEITHLPDDSRFPGPELFPY